MHVRAEIAYPTGSAEQVFALITRADFREDVCRATSALTYAVDIRPESDGRVSVTVERTVPASVPDLVKRFVGETITIVQTEHWRAPQAGEVRVAGLDIEVKGQPARLTGSATLEPVGSGCREVIVGDLRVSVPFVGKQIEPSVAEAILAGARIEERTGQQWLSRLD